MHKDIKRHLRTRPIYSNIALDRYVKFVAQYSNQESVKYKTALHHILPKAEGYFPQFKKEKWNLVNLPHKAHMVAHWMLAEALGGTMWYALNMMSKDLKTESLQNKIDLEMGKVNSKKDKRKKVSDGMKKRWKDPEYRKTQIAAQTGKTGLKSEQYKPFTIYNNNDIAQFTMLYGLYGSINEIGFNNLPGTSLWHSAKNPGEGIYLNSRSGDITKMIKKGQYKYKGWYAIDVSDKMNLEAA